MVRWNSTLLPFIAVSSARLVWRRAFDVCTPGRQTQIIAGRASDRTYAPEFDVYSLRGGQLGEGPCSAYRILQAFSEMHSWS